MKWKVRFVQVYDYLDIEAKDEDEAFDKAKEEFNRDMHYPVARTMYDDWEVVEEDEELTI